jgi:integrase
MANPSGTTKKTAGKRRTPRKRRKNDPGYRRVVRSGCRCNKAPGTHDVWQLEVFERTDLLTGKPIRARATFHGGDRDAGEKLAELVTEVKQRQAADTEGTFGFLLERHLRWVEANRSPTTHDEYRRLADKVIIPALGDIQLRKLTADHLDALYDRETARGVVGKTVGATHALIRSTLNVGMRRGWVASNVAQLASPPRRADREILPPTVATMLAILAAADDMDPDFGMLCRVAAAIGCRRGELCGLAWSDIEPENEQLVIRNSVAVIRDRHVKPGRNGRAPRKIVVKDTKSHQRRVVPLDPGTLALLAAHRQRVLDRADMMSPQGLADAAFVFSRQPDGSEPLRPKNVSDAFTRARKRAGVPQGRANLKGFRHLAASAQLAAGVPLATVSKTLGHRRQTTTLDFYAHAMPQNNRAGAVVMGRLLGGALPGPPEPKELPPGTV